MNVLLIIDSEISPSQLRVLKARAGDRVCLFPLTSQQKLLEDSRRELINMGCLVEMAPAAALVDEAALRLRLDYLRWVGDLPKTAAGGGPDLRELFAVDPHASLWWFSLVAEKSPLKSNAFNTLAQLEAIARLARSSGAQKLAYSLGHAPLRQALRRLALDRELEFISLGPSPARRLRDTVFDWPGTRLVVGALRASWYAMRTVSRGVLLRSVVDVFQAREAADRELLVVAYWPFFDQEAARRGIFRHRQAGSLIESLQASGRKVSWCLIWNSAGVDSLAQAIGQARRLSRGNRLIFPETELGLRGLFGAALVWLRCAWRFYRAEKTIARAHSLQGMAFYELFRDDWYSSFAGVTGCIGLLHYASFQALFKKLRVETCLYYCEMLEWEKALLCAAKAQGRPRLMFGYQSGTVSPMLLNYFHVPAEIVAGGRYAMPRPHRILCNGELNRRRLAESGWNERDLVVVEAIRYDHVRKSLLGPRAAKQKLVLVVFSAGIVESGAELAVVYQALHDLPQVEVRLRSHPGMPLRHLLRQGGFPPDSPPFPVAEGALDDWLSRAEIVIAGGETGVAVEALASGCWVVTIQIPEHFNMSPLRGINLPGVRCVTSPPELRRAVVETLERDGAENRDPATLTALSDFFCFGEGGESRRFVDLLGRSL